MFLLDGVKKPEAMSRSEEPKKRTLMADFTNEHVSLRVDKQGGCVTRVEHLLEPVAADDSRGAPQLSQSVVPS